MPWSNQNGGGGGGGGPWGGGGNNGGGGGNNQGGPWGQGPNRPRGGGGGGGNGGPPDLEEIIRRSQDRFKNLIPGGMNGGVVAILVLIVLAFVGIQSVYTVRPDELGVETRFGKPKDAVATEGLHVMLWPVESVEIVKIRQQQLNIGVRSNASTTSSAATGVMLTGDQNIVNVQFSVLYTVTDPKSFLFNIEAPVETLQQVSESAMREIVGRRPAQDIFRDNRQQIATEVQTIIQSTMDGYGAGVAVNAVSIEDAAPPREVADAFDEVQRAEQDEDRFVSEANQYANQKLGAARGQAAQIVEEANGYKSRVVNEASGEAQRFISIYDQYSSAPEVTRQRMFIETMEQVLKGSNKVIIDEKQGVMPYLPLNEIMRNNPNAAPRGGN
ncbi:FtsH protease activity modulator HflK [Agrobacterium bohemicum]|uniref:Protein HflK n=1 Tax=Agrobacterium bohemicum TaxID=2052828 RepID=A0A135P3N8_9HYPH|nr:FtsH protease activity modulator HflK [Agrobacterium bohemicum]KXG86042.1 phage tail protein [Agrobacterium bohemicum]